MNACHCECSTGVGAFRKKVLRKCQTPLDKPPKVWYNVRAVKREVPTRDAKMGDEVHRVKKVRKKEKFPIDKPPDLCYNKGVKRKGLVNSQSGRCFSPRKFLEKSSKNLLTNPLKCDTIRAQREGKLKTTRFSPSIFSEKYKTWQKKVLTN